MSPFRALRAFRERRAFASLRAAEGGWQNPGDEGLRGRSMSWEVGCMEHLNKGLAKAGLSHPNVELGEQKPLIVI